MQEIDQQLLKFFPNFLSLDFSLIALFFNFLAYCGTLLQTGQKCFAYHSDSTKSVQESLKLLIYILSKELIYQRKKC